MPLKGNISVSGINNAINTLRSLPSFDDDHSDFLQNEIEPWLRREFRRCFETDGYGTWRNLDADTLESRRDRGLGSEPLEVSGRYRRACEQLAGKRLRKDYLEIRSPIPYARYLEFGTRTAPARPVFILVAERLREKIERLYVSYHNRRRR